MKTAKELVREIGLAMQPPQGIAIVLTEQPGALKRKDPAYRSGRSPDWLKMKTANAPAVKRAAEEDWGKEKRRMNDPRFSAILRPSSGSRRRSSRSGRSDRLGKVRQARRWTGPAILIYKKCDGTDELL